VTSRRRIERLGVHEQDAKNTVGLLPRDGVCDTHQGIARGLVAEVPPPTGPGTRRKTHASVPEGSSNRKTAREKGAPPPARPRQQASIATISASEGPSGRPVRSTRPSPTSQVEAWIEQVRAAGRFAFDTETTARPEAADFVGFSMAVRHGQALDTCNTASRPNRGLGFRREHPKAGAGGRGVAVLRPLLEGPTVIKIGQNLKYDCMVAGPHGIKLDPSRHHVLS